MQKYLLIYDMLKVLKQNVLLVNQLLKYNKLIN